MKMDQMMRKMKLGKKSRVNKMSKKRKKICMKSISMIIESKVLIFEGFIYLYVVFLSP